ncbi:saccharopine dehydrogenase NADP-binding domain-containing protein [Rhodococcus rhodochrous]|uniref:saccharopine dehydrogenase family protein n=1 Tax=Rhodococcus rhodochrous TaxID=1829 RepID=UPI001E5C807B|nr:saccharopine dehydrogenase NADP-binding domain-containing protein [Rhodococcus rhodochrous]MCB8913453.1 saccharopine dehydrogenase NADP-binding domain-containing protein [Rhodococcus rhodochrous]
MRVVFVGGAGAMGSRAVRTAAGFDEFTELVIADFNLEAAQSLAAELGPRVSAVKFDANTDDARALFDGAWGVLSTLGPFTRFGTKIMGAAIASGCHYVDINDDWEPTLEALELTQLAKDARVTALIGMGQSPGVTNVLAAKVADELDEVHELITAWNLSGTRSDAPGKRPDAAMVHFVHQTTGTIRVIEDGRWADVRPMQELSLFYPGIGNLAVRTIGHPEAITLPRTFTGLQRCVNVMAGPAWYFDQMAARMAEVDAGRLSPLDAAILMEEEPPVRPADAPSTPHTPTLWAWASGKKNGVDTIAVGGMNRWPTGKMPGSTGTPAAVALRLLAWGEIKVRGVVTPEEAIPADLFFAELDPLYTEPHGTEKPLIEITTVAVESTNT